LSQPRKRVTVIKTARGEGGSEALVEGFLCVNLVEKSSRRSYWYSARDVGGKPSGKGGT